MSVIFSADFTAALDLTTLWSDEASPQVWSTTGGLLACSSSSFRVLNTRTGAHAAIADVLVKATRASATFDGCLIARSNVGGATSSTGNCYCFNIYETDTVEFIRRNAGANNTLATFTSVPHANGDTYSFKTTGTGATVTLTGYINDIQVATFDDTAGARIVAAGQTGFVGFSSSSRYDDFSVDDLAGAGGAAIAAMSNFYRRLRA